MKGFADGKASGDNPGQVSKEFIGIGAIFPLIRTSRGIASIHWRQAPEIRANVAASMPRQRFQTACSPLSGDLADLSTICCETAAL